MFSNYVNLDASLGFNRKNILIFNEKIKIKFKTISFYYNVEIFVKRNKML